MKTGKMSQPLRVWMLVIVAVNAAMVGYGLLRFPAAVTNASDGILGPAANAVVLAAYGLAAWFGVPATEKHSPLVLKVGIISGLAGGVVYVFQVLADFQRSGMSDLRAFIMGDFLGAGFFHPLLGVIAAFVLGSLGGLVGKGIRRHALPGRRA